MTRDEFRTGWDLLLAQPWGRNYRTVGNRESARMAATQLEFYYRKLEKFPLGMWAVAAELFAMGDHWPSVDEVRTMLNNGLPKHRQIAEVGPGGVPMPEPMALGTAYAAANHVTFLEGMHAVIPQWLEDHPVHADRDMALRWWDEFKHAKPCKGSLGHATAAAFRTVGIDD